MKKITDVVRTLAIVLSFCATIGWTNSAKACMEVIPKIHAVVCHYDSTNWQNFAVRIGSLRMTGDAPGTFCTCAFHNNSPIFDLIDYIAIVDSGTNNRTAGLSPWYASSLASSGWDSIYQIIWDGYLSQVQGGGTIGNQPVELIIRAHFTPGYALIPMRNDMLPTILGWGSWNDTLDRPNPDRWWMDLPTDSTFEFIPVFSPTSFFTDLDADLFAVGTTDFVQMPQISVFPNPTTEMLFFRNGNPRTRFQAIEVFDAMGKRILHQQLAPQSEFALNVADLPPANYFARLQTSHGTVTQRFVVTQ